MNLSEEEIHQDREGPEEYIVYPVCHGIFLLVLILLGHVLMHLILLGRHFEGFASQLLWEVSLGKSDSSVGSSAGRDSGATGKCRSSECASRLQPTCTARGFWVAEGCESIHEWLLLES